jgi:hypothetical protein
VWIWEQTATISLYNINWLVCITETECVYCAVRTGSLYIILRSAPTVYLCVLCGYQNKQLLFPYTTLTNWLLYNWDGVCLLRGTEWVFKYNAFGKSLCTYKRCWKWCPQASIQTWTRLIIFANTFCGSACEMFLMNAVIAVFNWLECVYRDRPRVRKLVKLSVMKDASCECQMFIFSFILTLRFLTSALICFCYWC